jgi:FkbM family methyltransferase
LTANTEQADILAYIQIHLLAKERRMSVAQSTVLKRQTRQWLSAAGLLPLARRAARVPIEFRCAFRRRFQLEIDGRHVCFLTNDAHSTSFFHRRYLQGKLHEPPVTAELARRARGARVFADVGAHVAYYSCIAGALNEHLRLFLFEMNHDMVPVIERNLNENGLTHAVVVNRPVADHQRVVSYAQASGGPGLSMRDPAGAGDAGQILAETITLDGFFAEQGAWPDLIKIDVEGAEFDVLRGARQLIARHHPVMFVEVHPEQLGNFNADAEQVYEFLRGYGYTLQRFVSHRSDGTGLEPIHAAAPPADGTHMLLCVWLPGRVREGNRQTRA